jgi:hypothetical protein
MSLPTLDAETLQQMVQRAQHAAPQGEPVERWIAQAAMGVIGATLLAVFLV